MQSVRKTRVNIMMFADSQLQNDSTTVAEVCTTAFKDVCDRSELWHG